METEAQCISTQSHSKRRRLFLRLIQTMGRLFRFRSNTKRKPKLDPESEDKSNVQPPPEPSVQNGESDQAEAIVEVEPSAEEAIAQPIYELVRNPNRVMAAAMFRRPGNDDRSVIIMDVDRNNPRDRDPVRFIPCQIGEAERAVLSASFPPEIIDMCIGQTAWLGISTRPCTVHSRVDYTHQLVSDLASIAKCSFYWGKIDRYEAERLLENHPEGTFLLRDSAQEGHLFSVSFRRFGRSLHARIELSSKHQFTFDSHDPSVYSAPTVADLISHYKEPAHCMFFEPMLLKPLNRNFVFSLQHYARIAITSCVSYDDVNTLPIPQTVKNYLKEYHYRFKIKTQDMDVDPLPVSG